MEKPVAYIRILKPPQWAETEHQITTIARECMIARGEKDAKKVWRLHPCAGHLNAPRQPNAATHDQNPAAERGHA